MSAFALSFALSASLSAFSILRGTTCGGAKGPVSKIPEIIAMFTISCVASYFLIGPKGYLASMAVAKLRKSIEASSSVNEQDLERLISLYEFQRKKKEASEYRAYRATLEGEANKKP